MRGSSSFEGPLRAKEVCAAIMVGAQIDEGGGGWQW
jgi:hypothetical protein